MHHESYQPQLFRTEKWCPMCSSFKALTGFHKNRAKRDGLATECKDCQRAKNRRYRQENKEHIASYLKAYREANQEAIADSKKSWYEKNKEHASEQGRQYREDNFLAKSARDKQYKDKNKEHTAAVVSRWGRNNRERLRAASVNYRARKKQSEGHHTHEDIARIRAEQQNKCYWCGVALGAFYHVDHLVPLSRGGSNWPDNLGVTCASCNTSKMSKTPGEYRAWLQAVEGWGNGEKEQSQRG